MLIQPGANVPSTLDCVDMIRTNSNKVVDVTFMDDCGVPVNIDETLTPGGEPNGELYMEVTNINGSVIYSESYWPPSSPDDRRVTNPATGKYQIKWGTGDLETTNAGPLLFNWHIRKDASSEDFYRTQVAEIVSPKTLSLLPRFRLLLDKSLKLCIPAENYNLGFSDAQLVIYLQAGLSRINSAQPYPSWSTIDQFPSMSWELLTRSALHYALMSQLLFAVDTDVNFNDQGHSFFITHGTQLKGILDSLSAELARDIREFKQHYLNSGSVATEMRVGFSFYQMIAASPSGSTFRNAFTNV